MVLRLHNLRSRSPTPEMTNYTVLFHSLELRFDRWVKNLRLWASSQIQNHQPGSFCTTVSQGAGHTPPAAKITERLWKTRFGGARLQNHGVRVPRGVAPQFACFTSTSGGAAPRRASLRGVGRRPSPEEAGLCRCLPYPGVEGALPSRRTRQISCAPPHRGNYAPASPLHSPNAPSRAHARPRLSAPPRLQLPWLPLVFVKLLRRLLL